MLQPNLLGPVTGWAGALVPRVLRPRQRRIIQRRITFATIGRPNLCLITTICSVCLLKLQKITSNNPLSVFRIRILDFFFPRLHTTVPSVNSSINVKLSHFSAHSSYILSFRKLFHLLQVSTLLLTVCIISILLFNLKAIRKQIYASIHLFFNCRNLTFLFTIFHTHYFPSYSRFSKFLHSCLCVLMVLLWLRTWKTNPGHILLMNPSVCPITRLT